MRLVGNIIATRMISDNFDHSLERQRTVREDCCNQSVSLRQSQRWSFFKSEAAGAREIEERETHRSYAGRGVRPLFLLFSKNGSRNGSGRNLAR